LKIITIYDGTIHSKTALQYGLRKIQEKGGELIVLQVFQASLFLDYDAGPRAEEIARAETARQLRDAEAIIRAAGIKGIPVRVISEEGETVQETVRIAEKEKADLILSPPRYKAIVKKAGCPVYIMPGTILVPIDNTLRTDRETIGAEARATGSKILLLGIVPVHLYSPGEKAELDRITKGTAAAVRKIRNNLREQGIEASEDIRAGYPDEEILKAADEFSVSLIMLPAGGKTPSELTKAGAILVDEPGRLRMPVYLIPACEG
jgi:nucleotide-binding universal stress UspA family protein